MYFSFTSVGIMPGDLLSSTLDTSIKATVLDDRYIQVENSKKSLSGATLDIMKAMGRTPISARGTAYWTFQGQKLVDLKIIKNHQ